MLAHISDDHMFEGDDAEKFDQLISDMADWMNKYADLFDDPETILEDLEMPEVEDIEEPAHSEQPVVLSFALKMSKRIDMTTLDKRHGGRHLHRHWGNHEEHENDGHFEAGEGHHRGGHGGHRRGRRCHGRGFFGGFFFVVMIVSFLVIMKMKNRRAWKYERLNDLHIAAVERNLSVDELNTLYVQFNTAGWC